MPNHCLNELQITGTKDEINNFIQFAKSKKENAEYDLFEALTPMPKDFIGVSSPNPDPELAKALVEKYGYSDWYSWAVDTWGTKWGDYEGCMSDIYVTTNPNEYTVTYDYTTAWSPGDEFLCNALAEQFPTMKFYLFYDEPGMGFKGEVFIENGQIVNNTYSEYEIECNEDGDPLEDEEGGYIIKVTKSITNY